MNIIWNSAIALLLITGAFLGLTLPLGKIAGAAGVAPVLWAFVISGGAGSVLAIALALRGGWGRPTPAKLRYFFITAAISYALPNIVMFSVIPHLGAGFTGIMFTLSPVVTLLFSTLLGVQRPTPLGVAGIAVGFVGALIVALTRGQVGQPAELSWVLIGLTIPLLLAAGNVYRTIDWPSDAGPIELAAGSHLASALMLLAAMLATGGAHFGALGAVPVVTLTQIAASSLMFVFFFRLQAVGGPVYLSQIGYVAAAIGLASGIGFLGESYGWMTWAGAAIITVGIAMTTKAQLRSAKT